MRFLLRNYSRGIFFQLWSWELADSCTQHMEKCNKTPAQRSGFRLSEVLRFQPGVSKIAVSSNQSYKQKRQAGLWSARWTIKHLSSLVFPCPPLSGSRRYHIVFVSSFWPSTVNKKFCHDGLGDLPSLSKKRFKSYGMDADGIGIVAGG